MRRRGGFGPRPPFTHIMNAWFSGRTPPAFMLGKQDMCCNGINWFLATIDVDPAHQGCGIGSTLLAPVLARADEQRSCCFRETHAADNVRLYERHGFRVVEHIEDPATVPLWVMLRPPAGAS
jgi:ribosomal protein S18 acetylase RimI-like enzyme